MREIKFRAFIKKKRKMYYGWNIVPDYDVLKGNKLFGWFGDTDSKEEAWQGYTYNQFELMQFTGLLDKQGKEIYEGDIVKTINEHIGIIEFFYGVYRTNEDDGKIRVLGIDIAQSNIEVIGNIYENPELLK
jgi:uncharacterized phage protein (TIGR01671 family)